MFVEPIIKQKKALLARYISQPIYRSIPIFYRSPKYFIKATWASLKLSINVGPTHQATHTTPSVKHGGGNIIVWRMLLFIAGFGKCLELMGWQMEKAVIEKKKKSVTI